MRISLGVLALLAASPAFAADQFDLECIGTMTETVEQEQILKVGEQVNLIIDIKSGQYCYKPCQKVLPIEDVFADRIILREYTAIEPGIRIDFLAKIDRKTGEYTYISDTTRPSRRNKTTVAACSLKPFTGFPATKF